LADSRNLELTGDLCPGLRSKVKDVEIIKIANLIPASKDKHIVSMDSSAESASGIGSISVGEGSDICPSLGIEIKLVNIIEVSLSRKSSKHIHTVFVHYRRMTSALSRKLPLCFDLSPGLGLKVELVEVIEPGAGEAIPTAKGNELVLVYHSSKSRASSKRCALSLNECRGAGGRVVHKEIVCVVVAVVTSQEPEEAIVLYTLMLCLGSHAVLGKRPFPAGKIVAEQVVFHIAYQIGHSLSGVSSVEVHLIFHNDGGAPKPRAGGILLGFSAHEETSPMGRVLR